MKTISLKAYNQLVPPKCPECKSLVWVRIDWLMNAKCQKCGFKASFAEFLRHGRSYLDIGMSWLAKLEGFDSDE